MKMDYYTQILQFLLGIHVLVYGLTFVSEKDSLTKEYLNRLSIPFPEAEEIAPSGMVKVIKKDSSMFQKHMQTKNPRKNVLEFIQIKPCIFVYAAEFYITLSSMKLSQLEKCIGLSCYDLPLTKCTNDLHNYFTFL